MTISAPAPHEHQARVRATSAKMLDAAEHMLDRINNPEPAHCLGTCIPALPQGVLTRILSVKAMRQRMRRR